MLKDCADLKKDCEIASERKLCVGMRFIDKLKKYDLEGKKVLIRVDFNVRVDMNHDIDGFKVKAHIETIDYLLNNGATVVMLSHIDPPLTSFSTIVAQIAKVLGRDVNFVSLPDFLAGTLEFAAGTLALVDNVRQDPRESHNDDGFAQNLVNGFDLYVDDAFAVMHRNHSSLVAAAKFLPAYAGLLVRKETENLQQAINAPREGKVLVMGGAKISTKLPVIKNFIDKAEKILIGGALANNFFQSQGFSVGASLVDGSVAPDEIKDNMILPSDILTSKDKSGNSGASASAVRNLEPDELIIDLGPESAKIFGEIIAGSKLVIWNGPMGLSEVESFAEGTKMVASAVTAAPSSVIGGGDTITAVDRYDLLSKIGFISTGGGAMLEFLAGNKLPGLEALHYY